MTLRIADDFAAIAAAMRATNTAPEEPVCLACEGGGWQMASYQAAGAPNFELCQECGNPEDFPCP